MIAQECPQQAGVEMIAIFHPERKMPGRDGCLALPRQHAVQQKITGRGRHIQPHAAVAAINEKGLAGVIVDLGGEGVAVIGRAGGTPPGKADIRLVGGLAARHPIGLGNAHHLEKALQRGGGAFADADGGDVGRLDQFDGGAGPAVGQHIRRHPARRAAATDHKTPGRHHAPGACIAAASQASWLGICARGCRFTMAIWANCWRSAASLGPAANGW